MYTDCTKVPSMVKNKWNPLFQKNTNLVLMENKYWLKIAHKGLQNNTLVNEGLIWKFNGPYGSLFSIFPKAFLKRLTIFW